MSDFALLAGCNAPALAGIRDTLYRRGDDDLTDEDKIKIIALAESLIVSLPLEDNS